jgi:hypothetical protein
MLILALAVAQPVAAQSIEAGVDAAKRGDYATALKHIRPLANPRRYLRSINQHSIFPFKIKCCVDQLRPPPEADIRASLKLSFIGPYGAVGWVGVCHYIEGRDWRITNSEDHLGTLGKLNPGVAWRSWAVV